MSRAALHALADAAGLCADWTDAGGEARRVDDAVLARVLAALGHEARSESACREALRRLRDRAGHAPMRVVDVGVACDVGAAPGAAFELRDDAGDAVHGRLDAQGRVPTVSKPGYYTLAFRGERGDAQTTLAVCPPRCFSPADAFGAGDTTRRWGIAAQAYSVRGEWDAGIGDAAGMAAWVDRVASLGGDAVALSPLHAPRTHGRYFSPYSPSDRRFLDPMHAAPGLVLGDDVAHAALDDAGLRDTFLALQAQPLIDWPGASAAKWRWLHALHRRFGDSDGRLHDDFDAFVQDGGEPLDAFVRFASADAAQLGNDGIAHDPDLHRFAQWLAARSWSSLQARARDRGMGIGLIADLAVGFDPHGSEATGWRDAALDGLTLGAPPDAFNADGQGWGVTSWSPDGLRNTGYAPFLQLLRATLRDRGGVRIDHILGLMRLWVVSDGAAPRDGVYLRYPLDDLLRLLALESWRHRAIVIGEDLGVVPEGFRDELARRGVLGIDVLLFTRDEDGAFLPPERWRRDAIATTTTHDLPTLSGWRAARDIEWRARIAGDSSGCDAQKQERQSDVERLRDAVGASRPASGDETLDWVRFTASAPAPLALLPLEDALALDEQPNLPGTVGDHPNWRRRLPDPLPLDTLTLRLQAFAQARAPNANANTNPRTA
ncbi:4-alpha-glucanotransferase [Lysobacter auxotrophicus]|uniref:4-alpha-glucanotransferase n=1 Tax=Lysobacter auxotrophicus TaxID=2992573 RepID=A0ABM8DDA3_9GAMM|nr:4-alpha-glucanotransferase [Lysobacter auxotrophicus]BDU16530.1 4-alpha-glucanotransferase [Lysobacter auxotrophicus]